MCCSTPGIRPYVVACADSDCSSAFFTPFTFLDLTCSRVGEVAAVSSAVVCLSIPCGEDLQSFAQAVPEDHLVASLVLCSLLSAVLACLWSPMLAWQMTQLLLELSMPLQQMTHLLLTFGLLLLFASFHLPFPFSSSLSHLGCPACIPSVLTVILLAVATALEWEKATPTL